MTVVDPGGTARATRVCALGELASWLHLTPETSLVGSPLEPLGPLYVVRFDVIGGPQPRRLVELRLYPRAPDAPVVFLAEPGFMESQTYTGSVLRGWRLLDPGVRVPATLTSIGVPRAVRAPVSESPAASPGRRSGPDVISIAFLAALGAMVVVALVRHRSERPR